MKKQLITLSLSFLIYANSVAWVHPQPISLFSTFDDNAQGWTIEGNASVTVPNYNSSGGNPGGFIDCVEATGNAVWFFVAPTAWNGDWTNYTGATLRFDLKSFQETGAGDVNNVRIYSGSNFAAWDYPITPPAGVWTRFEVDITASNFDRISGTPGTTFESIISNVTAFWIRGDYGGVDRGGIDNVRIIPLGSISEIAASFASSGIWVYDPDPDVSLWTQITPSIPENIIYSDTTLYAEFGAGGIWMWNGTSWSMLTPSNPENMVISGTTLYAEFGVGGIWMYNGSSWTMLTPSNPENMVASGSTLYAEFGAGGLWRWNGSSWTMLTPSNPENMVVSGSTLYADFGAGGLYMWNGVSWTMLTASNPIGMAVSN